MKYFMAIKHTKLKLEKNINYFSQMYNEIKVKANGEIMRLVSFNLRLE